MPPVVKYVQSVADAQETVACGLLLLNQFTTQNAVACIVQQPKNYWSMAQDTSATVVQTSADLSVPGDSAGGA